LVYNSFQPTWISDDNRELRIQVDERISAIAQRYGNFFDDADVINEMYTIYKNCYKENGYHGFCARNLQITDDRDHEKWAFDLCHKYFPHTKLFWNEGGVEIFKEYTGYRSVYYMLLERFLTQGGHLDGIGMQYHLYSEKEKVFDERKLETNPLRLIDVFDCYGEFGLPIHMSEISIPSYSNEREDEELQAELAKRLYKLWFGRKNCEAIVWWNLADGTAYQTENQFFAGMIRNDCSEKPIYQALDQLINHEWHTELSGEAADGLLPFRGFYGDYEVEATYQGRRVVKNVRLYRDTTGYDNWRCDFRKTDVVL
jgi:GH35 family endo-1,4-beta-xylanase